MQARKYTDPSFHRFPQNGALLLQGGSGMNIPGIRTQHLGRWDPEQSLLVLQDFLAMAHTHAESVGHGAALLRLGSFVACAVAAL